MLGGGVYCSLSIFLEVNFIKKFAKVLVLALAVFMVVSFAGCNDGSDDSDGGINVELPGTGGGSSNKGDPFAGKTFYDRYDDKVKFGDDGTFTQYLSKSSDESGNKEVPFCQYRYSLADGKIYWVIDGYYDEDGHYQNAAEQYDAVRNDFDTYWEKDEAYLRRRMEKNGELWYYAISTGLPPDSTIETVIQKIKDMYIARSKLYYSQITMFSYIANGADYILTECITDKNGLEMYIFDGDFSDGSNNVEIRGSESTDCLAFSAYLSGLRYRGYMNESEITFYNDNSTSYTFVYTVNYTVVADVANNKKTMKFKFNDKNYELVYKSETTTFYSEKQNND